MSFSSGDRVRVRGLTSKPEFNGQEGVVERYIPERDRYQILCALNNGERRVRINLKSSNLIPASSTRWTALARAARSRWIRLARQFVPPSVSDNTILMVFALAAIIYVYVLGPLKGLAIAAIVLYVGFVSGVPQEYARNQHSGPLKAAECALHKLGNDIKNRLLVPTMQKIPFLTAQAGNVRWYHGAIAFALSSYVLIRITSSSTSPTTNVSLSSSSTTTTSFHSTPYDEDIARAIGNAYEAGFQDASGGHDFGHTDMSGLARDVRSGMNNRRGYNQEDLDYSAPYTAPTSSSFGFGKMITVGLLGFNVWSLGKTPNGGWDVNVAVRGFQYLPTMRKALMGFLVLRVLGLSPF